MSNSPTNPASPSDRDTDDPFCGSCGYSLKGLQDSARCPECGKPIVDVLMRSGFPVPAGRRYRSSATIFGWPVIDIATGPARGQRIGKARGWIAIGDTAFGALAVGGMPCGIVSVGGLAVGFFSVGGLSVGLFTAFGGFAASAGLASGGFALGTIANGGFAMGYIAQGAFALGEYARDALHRGKHPQIFHRLRWILGAYPPHLADQALIYLYTLVPGFIAALFISLIALVRIQRQSSDDQVPRK